MTQLQGPLPGTHFEHIFGPLAPGDVHAEPESATTDTEPEEDHDDYYDLLPPWWDD